VSWWDFWGRNDSEGDEAFTIKPAMTYSGVIDGATGTPVEYFILTDWSGDDFVDRWRLVDPLGSGPDLQPRTSVSVNSYSVPPAGKQSGGGSSLLIDTFDCRTLTCQYRNGEVYFGCSDSLDWGTPSNVEAVIHYWKLAPFTMTVVWDSRFGADDFYYFFPAIKADADEDAHIVFNRTGSSEFPGIRMTGRLSTDGSTQGSASVKAGEATYNPSGDTVERWGDYNGLGVDCAGDQKGVWMTSQYSVSSSSWSTWVAGTSFGQPNVLQQVAKVAEDTYITPSLLSHGIVCEFCRANKLPGQIEKLKALYAPRLQACLDALDQHLPDAEATRPNGGFFLSVTLPEGTTTEAVIKQGKGHNLNLAAGQAFFPDGGGERFLRLPYCALSPEEINDGITRLAAAVKEAQG